MKTLALVLFAVGCQKPAVTEVPDAPAAAVVATPRTTAPWRLTASDGSGLALTTVDARAVVEGPLAYTELHLAFHNDENRVREGTFAIDLPPGATVSRFAMEIDGGWMEAEVVPKMVGRIAYDDALHARRDPALLERGAGNSFTAKVFPIPARADKRIILAFSQPLRGEAYALPLMGLPRTERVAVSLNGAVQFDQRNWAPDRDFVAPVQAARAAVGNGTIAAAVTIPRDATEVELDEVSVLVDTSASRAKDFAAYVDKIRRAIVRLPAKRVQVVGFDQDSELLYDGAPSGFTAEALIERGAAGATDLHKALERPLLDRVVVITDGVDTLGDVPKPERRVDVVLTGGGELDLGGSVLDLDQTAPPSGGAARERPLARDRDDLARELRRSPPAQVPIVVEGAAWSYPKTARAGDTVMVYALGPAQVVINGQRLTTIDAEPALIGRAIAGAEIAELEAKHDPSLAKQIEAKSIASRVISSQTAMIVLERDSDYARYKVERTADQQVLEILDGKLAMTHEPRVELAKEPTPQEARQQAIEAARTAGILGSTSFASLDSNADISSGFDDSNVYGGLLGNEVAEAPGAYGLGRSGFGPGGGGTGEGTIGTGRYGTIGHGSGTGNGYGVGAGRGGARGRTYDDTAVDNGPRDRGVAPLTGKLNDVMIALNKRDLAGAEKIATAWHAEDPDDVLGIIAMGEVQERYGRTEEAVRTYGSIIELHSTRAEMLRFAGERLLRAGGLDLAIAAFRKAVADRPDHLTGHRLLAYALLRAGDDAGALAAIQAGLAQKYPAGRFLDGERILRDDLGMIAAHMRAHGEAVPPAIASATEPSTRFVLSWETDGNDVDFHIRDAKGNHAWYGHRDLASGGELYADVTTGFGPECFAIQGVPTAGPYALAINYYSQGPEGYGMGILQIQRFDGRDFAFQDRPFVIMQDHAFVDLGTL